MADFSWPMMIPVTGPDVWVSVEVDGKPWTDFGFNPLTGIVTLRGLPEGGSGEVHITVGHTQSPLAVRFEGWNMRHFKASKKPRQPPPSRGPASRQQWWNR